jgi:hypothetical protein
VLEVLSGRRALSTAKLSACMPRRQCSQWQHRGRDEHVDAFLLSGNDVAPKCQRRLGKYLEATNSLSQWSAEVKTCHRKHRDARIKVRRKYWQVTGTLRQVPGQSSYLQGRIGIERSRSDIITPKGCIGHMQKK